mgnify:CR=1 FL=1
MEHDNSGANTNTILIVLVLLVIVGFGVWYMKSSPKAETTDGIDIQLGGGGTE